MLKIIAVLLFMSSTLSVCFAYSKYNWRKFDRMIMRSIQDADRKATEQEEDDESETSAEVKELDFDINPDFDVEGVPYCDDGEVPYIDILHGYDRWYQSFAEKKNRETVSYWLRPALARLEGQCDAIDFATTNTQRLLDLLTEKGFTTIASGSVNKVQSVLNTFCKNREETVELLEQIDCTNDEKLLKKLKATLLCLMEDNDELINGLDTFQSGIQNILSKICEDQHPDHITDFTDLHELLEIPVRLDRALSEAMETIKAEEAKKSSTTASEIPTIAFPNDKRVADFFPTMGLTSATPATETEDNNTSSSITGGMSG